MLVQVVLQRVPAAAHADHHVIAEDLAKQNELLQADQVDKFVVGKGFFSSKIGETWAAKHSTRKVCFLMFRGRWSFWFCGERPERTHGGYGAHPPDSDTDSTAMKATSNQ